MKHDYLRIAQSSVDIGDPHMVIDSLDLLNLVDAIFETMVVRGGPGVYYPSLAQTWSVQPDGLTWLFKTREDVVFHNGNKFSAHDVVASLKRVVDPSLGGAWGTQGVYASYIGDALFEADRDYTFKITTSEPMADLLDLISEMSISPKDDLHRLPNDYIGTGPYSVASKKQDEIVLEENRDHWGLKTSAKNLVFKAVPDSRNRSEMVLEQDVEIGTRIEHTDTNIHEGSDKSFTSSVKSSMCVIFMMNAQKGPCSDMRVRQALNYGLDINEVVKQVTLGTATRLTGYLTPHHFGYNPETGPYPYDPDYAKELLAEAGYTDGLKLIIDIPTSSPDEAPKLGDIMKAHYSKIGIDVELVTYTNRAVYADMVRDKNIHDLCCFDSSPISTYRVLREKIHSGYKGPWWEGYSNPKVDRMIDQAQKTFYNNQRKEIYQQVFQIIRDDAPWVFLYRPTYHWALSKKLEGWKQTSTGILKFID
jgi:peptide/nickel transport system substrate-binding protein